VTRVPDELYAQVLASVPIACVDLVVRDAQGRVLLVRRTNEPARGAWWFPGGRVLRGEQRVDAVGRKLAEECGLTASHVEEVGTHDMLFRAADGRVESHAITTLFRVEARPGPVRLDAQSAAFEWRRPADWLREPGLHAFVRTGLA
jgi:colanic acid biosynthesis protein WcaH